METVAASSLGLNFSFIFILYGVAVDGSFEGVGGEVFELDIFFSAEGFGEYF